MIVPMLKYSFAVHHTAYRKFLDDLQELGMVHTGRSSERNPEGEAARLKDEAVEINHLLDQLKKIGEKDLPTQPKHLPADELQEQIRYFLEQLQADETSLEEVQKKLKERRRWGDYSDQLLTELEKAGLKIRFFVVAAKKFRQQWLEELPLEVISRLDQEVRFVLFGNSENPEGAKDDYPPGESVEKLLWHQDLLKEKLTNTRGRLWELKSGSCPVLTDRLRIVQNRLEWLDVRDNLTAQAGDGRICLLEGWIPAGEQHRLQQYLEEQGILYLQSSEVREEAPPVKLQNNRFGRLFEPISRLFSLPAYPELDLTVYFAPFFMLFFGFCLGDAGYGMVWLIGSTIAKKYVGSMKGFLTLGQLFGLSTMIMGLIFGTFFGIQLATVPALEGLRDLFLNSSRIFTLSLILGGIQIVFGIILRIKNQLRQEYPSLAWGSAGWLLLIFTAGLFEFLLRDVSLFPMLRMLRTGLYSASLFLILFFSGTGPVHLRLAGGIWDMYSNITGIFGDLLSYIRLFALGMASSILGLVVNQMAVSFGQAPYIGPVIFLLIIIVGHTANIAISSLGAFVHPMRLTFVEFYKNAGFKGGGKPYQPFSKQENHSST